MALITLNGNLGRDVEKVNIAGKNFWKFSIADNETKDKTTWWTVLSYCSPSSDNMAAYLKKGKGVVVTGRVSVNTYTKKDGTLGVDCTCYALDVQFAASSKMAESAAPSAAPRTAAPKAAPAPAAPAAQDANDDLPF